MAAKKDQHTVGTPPKPRGQQTGFPGNPDQNREEMKKTPAIRGRRKTTNKMAGDSSEQHVASDATTPSTNTPSTAGMNIKSKRDGGGAGGFKKRLAKLRSK
ncbi:MAG: hypothetical protein DMF69_03575 [Acidobacteria bacterium]|nr:MAG: hypothetical protein DMF69_03575 [Acidobacteriota bacterium]